MHILGVILTIVFIYLLLTYIMFILIFRRIDGRLLDIAHKKIYKNTERYKDKLEDVSSWLDSKSSMIKDVYINSEDKIKLHGIFIKNNNSKKIFVVVHGYRSSALKNLFISYPKYYEKGYNVFLIDQRCTGKSAGKYITLGIKESSDIICWIKYLNKEYKNCEIVLSGISMGASTILMACNRITKKMKVKSIISDCAYVSPYQEVKYFIKHYLHINGSILLFMINNWCKLFGKFDLKSNNTVSSISKNNIPILFIHGSSDNIVPFINSEINYTKYKSKKELLVIENASHAFSYFIDDEKYLNEVYKML